MPAVYDTGRISATAIFAGEPQAWTTMPSKTEKDPIEVPDGFTAMMLQTPPKPLPRG